MARKKDGLLQEMGRRLAEIRGERNDAQFARDLGLPRSTYDNYLNATASPKPSLYRTLMERENVNLTWFLTGRGPRRIGPGGWSTPDSIGELEARWNHPQDYTLPDDSMAPLIPQGSEVRIDPRTRSKDQLDGRVVALQIGDNILVRILWDTEAGWMLHAGNPKSKQWPPEPLDEKRHTILGIVQWAWVKFD